MGLFVYGLFESFAAFFGEAVFLEAAVGFVGDGTFDEAGFQQAIDLFVEFTGNGLVTEHSRQFRFTFRIGL